MNHNSIIDWKNSDPSSDGPFIQAPSAFCFVCGQHLRNGWFARMSTGRRIVFLCSAVCARMFFEVKHPPAHDHRARHNFERARAAILEAAHNILRRWNSC